ncbi:DUF885 family protein [Chitinophaga sp. CF418]|uniref:DUF885 domain-containing protein n=1 Tax=Chitinophaga sp. CF418 TaxID=1855287 RepID=UPI0009218A7F|nr:DUF885 domain-containing protein [Chitinophaga sp. CF418]SHM46027.1 Uncharacterized conserved protein, DUF885 familyt [Chitinophaga sp. CF418]
MKYVSLKISSFFMVCCCAFTTTAHSQQRNAKLHQLFENYYQESLRLDPISATFAGDHRYDAMLANDGSTSYLRLKDQFDKKYLYLLSGYNRRTLNTADQISFDVLKEILEMDVERMKYHPEYLPINQFSSLPLLVGQLGAGQSAQPFATVKDYENWFKRIAAFSEWTDTTIGNMRKGVSRGMVLPKVLVMKMIPQMESLAEKDTAKNTLFQPLNNFPPAISGQERERLKQSFLRALTTQLLPAYQRLADYLKNDYLPHATDAAGLSGIPGGKELYRYYVRYFTTTDRSPEEIYETGIKEVTRITAAMEDLKKQSGFTGTLQEYFVFLRTDRQFMPFKTAEEVIQAYQQIYDKIKPHLHTMLSVAPKGRFEIRRVEAFREASQNGPSYTIGAMDGSRPGIFYVPVPDPTKINVTFLGMEATFIHEAIPGHHYQISLQQENTALPTFRRQINFSAFTEGWALYCESFGKELGCYTAIPQQMGALNNEIHRAIRLVTDVGIHTGRMTREEAINYMLAHESISEEEAVRSVERYMAMPGQALTYKIGELEMLRLREKYRKMLGAGFNIIKFHDALLAQGDMPLKVLEHYMDNWAANH